MVKKKLTDTYYSVMGDYGKGWEEVTSEDTLAEINIRLKEYRTNEPEYKFKKVSVKEYEVIVIKTI